MQDSGGVAVARALKHAALCLLLLPRFLLAAVMLWLLDFLCIRRKLLLKMGQAQDADDPPVCVSDANRMFTVESLCAVWYGHKLDFLKSAHLGHTAPNTEVVLVHERRRVRLLDCVKGKRPLKLVRQFADIADFLVVYIEEAHPSDGWMSTDAPYQIPKHQCLEDRLRAARLMLSELPASSVVVDSMDNSSNAAYGAYFERLYVVRDAQVVYQGGRGPEGYRISELRHWLEEYRGSLRPAVLHV
uniref:Iodothyronine deiodinase n=1 Tax=Knipowitschia caucasica TaxID=637954 RepID=A0AAV2KA57_KNICA